MGYTHYWKMNKVKNITAKKLEETYQKAIKECQKIALTYNNSCKVLGLDEERLSGYSAHCKVGQYGGINLNGKEDLMHEDFILREHFNQNENFNFCKTAQKPYDIVVVACLAVLKYRLKDNIVVSSDGDSKDWTKGIELANHVLKLKIKNPITDQD